MPIRKFPMGEVIEYGSRKIVVRDDIMLMWVNKQRGGLPAGEYWPVLLHHDTGVIEAIDWSLIAP